MNSEAVKKMALAVLETEADAVLALRERIDHNFVLACQHLWNCSGRIVVTGMGKSGHVGTKIAATLASTGSPAFFLHPAEASHGDLGMITAQDVVLALSNSGETREILEILPIIKRQGVALIAMTGNPRSTLAKAATVNIDVTVEKEACPLGLAPTASTTATLAMGDALAISLLESRGFTEEDFARSHPGGTLGKRLLLRVEDLMHAGATTPRVRAGATIADALVEMTQKGLGMTTIVDAEGHLQGVFTDGDLRRALAQPADIQNTPIERVMTRNGHRVNSQILAAEALNVMQTYKIQQLVVVDDEERVIGALTMHDLLRAGVA
ncbi:MAG: KpsF/GutQ family sugar-phosphate isomerase [Pseudomonadota bacterium]|nr:KpsF/GutQ family sugar-phosphate isomerase [Pseudomonadota bacterium]